jgi:hypothetical protein
MKIVGQRRQAAGKMGVGNLGQAKFGHAMILPGRDYRFGGSRNDEILKSNASHSHRRHHPPTGRRDAPPDDRLRG